MISMPSPGLATSSPFLIVSLTFWPDSALVHSRTSLASVGLERFTVSVANLS
jgi:hypothetical protein